MPLSPFVAKSYDYGPTSRLSDLIRQRGRVGAEAELRNAAIRSRMAQDLAGVANQTLSSLAKYHEDAPKRELQQLQLDDAKARATERQTKTALDEAFNGTLARFTAKDPETGKLTVKWDELEAAFAQSPNAADLVPRLHQYRAGLATSAKAIRDNEQAIRREQALAYGYAAEALQTMGGDKDPASFALGLAALRERDLISDDEMTSMWKEVEDYAKGDPDRAAEAISRIVTTALEGAKPYQDQKPYQLDPTKDTFGPRGELIKAGVPVTPRPPAFNAERTALEAYARDHGKTIDQLTEPEVRGVLNRLKPEKPAAVTPAETAAHLLSQYRADIDRLKAEHESLPESARPVLRLPTFEQWRRDRARREEDAAGAVPRVAPVTPADEPEPGQEPPPLSNPRTQDIALPPSAPPPSPAPPAPNERRARALLDAYRQERDPARKAALAQELRALRAQVR